MWEKNRTSVQTAKRITTLLSDVWRDKDFILEIMNALENHFEECEDFILFLEAGSELVPSEIYEKVSEITNGEFVKDFSDVCTAKNRCIENTCDENWFLLFETLKKSTLLYVCEWDLTDEEKAAFENSDVGDTIHIETKTRPVILQDTDTGTAIIPVFTSAYEIKREYRGDEYALESTGWNCALRIFDSCRKVLGDALIVLDLDSDKCLEIDQELIEKYMKDTIE